MPGAKIPQNIAIVSHPKTPEALIKANDIANSLRKQNVQICQGTLKDEALSCKVKEGVFDLLIALGGDGTILRAGHLCAPHKLPILGINLGRFGFLMDVRPEDWPSIEPLLLKGEYWLENRMMVRVELWHDQHLTGQWDVLNEAVVCRGAFVRPIQINASINGIYLTTYVADGLIVSTPTGSTAYALAVGGPIMPPELRNILVVPIAPHLSVDRAIIIAEGSSINMSVSSTHQAVLSLDGQPSIPLEADDNVIAYTSENTVQFVRFQDAGYFYRSLTSHMNKNPSTGVNNR